MSKVIDDFSETEDVKVMEDGRCDQGDVEAGKGVAVVHDLLVAQ